MSDELSAAYWQGASEGRLVVQRCDQCGTLRHYPRLLCSSCYSFDWSPVEVARAGTVHSWTVSHHVFDPAVTTDVPYALVTVDMAEGVRVLGRIAADIELRPQLPVELTFVPNAAGRPDSVFIRPTT